MKPLILFCILLKFSFTYSQEKLEHHFGHYKGDLIINANGKISQVKMEFKLFKTDSPERFEYVLIYNSPEKTDERNYLLIQKDTLGNYVLDEQNGLKISTTYANNTLLSVFEIEKSLLSSRLEFKGNTLDFEILMSRTSTIDSSRTTDGHYMVKSYPISVVQKARLVKQ